MKMAHDYSLVHGTMRLHNYVVVHNTLKVIKKIGDNKTSEELKANILLPIMYLSVILH